MIIFGIILFTAVVVHLILHKVVLRAFEKRALASSHLWLQIITQNKLFHRLAFTLQGIIVNVRRCCGCKRQRGRGNINHRGPAMVMIYAMLSFFSLLDVILKLAQKFPAASQLPLKGIFGLSW